MTELIGKRLGEFEVVRELGRGGMGVVFEAVQTSLNRRVALKVLGPGLGLTPRAVQRFRREAEAAAKLHHTNIVPVYATGAEGGFHFYAMELIDGPSLDRVLADLRAGPGAPPTAGLGTGLDATGPYADPTTPAPGSGSGLRSGGAYFDTVARLVADVAEALAHAHANNVIHRDIKPGNLLLGGDGRLSVNDFGLARALEEPGMTTTGEFVGTPAYMAPEQIAGGRIPVDHRCDIYSLGATLYELLTLRPPFTADRRDQLLAMVVQKEPVAPRRVNPQVPRDLDTICLKCLEKDPDRRYRGAKELADDLRRYVNRFAIAARRAGPLTKLRKWVRRNPSLSGAGLAVVLALGAAGAFAWKARESERLRSEEKQRQDDELRAEKQRAAIDKGMVAALAADLPTAKAAIAEAEALGTSAGELHILRGFVAMYTDAPADAVREFRAAVEMMPDRVAPRALLSAAYVHLGDYSAGDRELRAAERMTPHAAEDHLFFGLALSPFDEPRAMSELRAAAERGANIAQVILADLLWQGAQEAGTKAAAAEALSVAETALRLLPKSSFTEINAARARVAAAAAHELAGEQEQAEEHLRAASRLMENMSGNPNGYAAIGTQVLVALYRDRVAVEQPLTRKLRFPTGVAGEEVADIEAAVLWRLGEIDKASARVALLKTTYYTGPVKVGLALERPGGRPEAAAVLTRCMAEDELPATTMMLLPFMHLTGEADRLPAEAARMRAAGKIWGRGVYRLDAETDVRFHEGMLTDAEYLAAPVHGGRSSTAWRKLQVGMKWLGAGDRMAAKKLLTEAYEMRVFRGSEWELLATFLIRMNADPEWPRAIPMKKL